VSHAATAVGSLDRKDARPALADGSRRTARPGRNDPCHCGSHRKYKRCCQQRDVRAARQARGATLPKWIMGSDRKLEKFLKYVIEVYGLPCLLGSFSDGRREPSYPTLEVVETLFHAALLRRPSINATEGDLKHADFQKLIGRKPEPGEKAFSAEVINSVLDKLDLDGPRNGIEDITIALTRTRPPVLI